MANAERVGRIQLGFKSDEPIRRTKGGGFIVETFHSRPISLVRSLEELSLNAWPALQTILYDGWLLRFSRGYTRRANSVNPIYDSTLPVEEKIGYCERIYGDLRASVVFKITPAATPNELDDALAKRGYDREATTSVQVVDLSQLATASDPEIVLSPRCEPVWIADYCRLNAIPERHVATMTAMLRAIAPATAYASFRHAGETLAVGLAVAERGSVGLFDIVTAPAARNRGIGGRVVSRLLQWGITQGATRGYLQVVDTNLPAINLYAKLSFQEAYTYWYRVKRI
jgi:GNAT superfamily N-acetyltransferase